MDGWTIFLVVLAVIVILVVIVLIILVGTGVLTGGNSFFDQKSQSHGAKSLVLSCIDYRFINETIHYLNTHRKGNFDYFVLAGSSLGYNESCEAHSAKEIPKDSSNNWHLTYEDHVRLAMKLHHITEIVVIDHMDCGYYQSVYGDAMSDPKKEKAKHKFNLHKFVRLMKNKEEFKGLDYVLLLAEKHSDGKISFKKMKQ